MPHVPWRAAAPGGRRGYQPGTDNAANRYYSVQSWPTKRVQRCGYKEVLMLLSIFVYAVIHDRRICSPRYHYLLFAPSSSSSFYACSPLSSRNTEESSLAAGYHLSRPAIHFVRSMKTAGLLLFLPKVYKEIFFFFFVSPIGIAEAIANETTHHRTSTSTNKGALFPLAYRDTDVLRRRANNLGGILACPFF